MQKLPPFAKRLDLVNKISTHDLKGEYLSNVDIDINGEAYLKTIPQIGFVGKSRLRATYISDQRDTPIHTPATFDIVGFRTTEYTVDANVKAVIAPVKATELVKLDGIADQSLFAFNVRGPLGRTQVNRDIVQSIRDKGRHKQFPLFHNGITIITGELNVDKDAISVQDYFVVNGCQSLTALYDNKKELTDNLRVLTKFIRLEKTSPLAATVTHFSNNQNGVKARDFMANTSIQIRLQNEFRTHYGGVYHFEIKRGEPYASGAVISNEDAGLYLMAFDLKEPWATHRKYQVFEEKHADIFGRPEVTADRIAMCQVIREAVDQVLPAIKNTLLAKYVLTRYLLMYIVSEILASDGLAQNIASSPKSFVRRPEDRDKFRVCIRRILDDVVIDLNAEVTEYGDNFDYRDKLRDSDWVASLSRKVVSDHLKLVNRGRIHSFKAEWEGAMGAAV